MIFFRLQQTVAAIDEQGYYYPKVQAKTMNIYENYAASLKKSNY